jgi:hypothetical protein
VRRPLILRPRPACQVLCLSGQVLAWRRLRAAPVAARWGDLTADQRRELVWAADSLDWRFLDAVIEAPGAPTYGPAIWEVTDPLPLLAEEPLRGRAVRQAASALRALVTTHEPALARALRAGRTAAAAALAAGGGGGGAGAAARAAEAADKLHLLKQLLQGTLGLSTGGRAVRGAEVRRGRRAAAGQAGAGDSRGGEVGGSGPARAEKGLASRGRAVSCGPLSAH